MTAVPKVGTRVRVKMNRLGFGTVRGYFLAEGGDGGLRFLGLAVELEDPPAEYVRQRQRQVGQLVATVRGKAQVLKITPKKVRVRLLEGEGLHLPGPFREWLEQPDRLRATA